MTKSPYDYQQEVYNKVIAALNEGVRSLVIQMATRSGKSIVATMLIEYFAGKSVYFVGHKNILITQMSEELEDNGIKHGIIAPWAPQLRYRVQVISKDTFFNRFGKMRSAGWEDPALIIVDECHISMSARYLEILKSYPNSVIIGMSATPCRTDGRGLGEIFERIIQGPSMETLQSKKRLCPIDTFIVDFDDSGLRTRGGDFVTSDIVEQVDKPAVLSNLVDHWEKIAKGEKTLTFCASIKHAEDVAQAFTDAGYPSVAISAKDGRQEIKRKIDDYYSGRYVNLCSVNLFIEGFTVKDCSCILQARPTKSLMIYLQSIGRGTIYLPGKILKNIDAVNNFSRFQWPEQEREWSLAGSPKLKESAKLKECPACFRPVAISARTCPHCGFLWAEREDVGTRMPKEKDGRLIKIERDQWNQLVLDVARNAHDYDDAVRIAGDKADDIWHKTLKNA